MTTNSSRDSAQFFGPLVLTTTVVNPDLVGEIRLILAPVDAELGHGNSQVQISTRSGTNKYTGAATWVVRNTALNANTWTNNHTPTLINGVQVSNNTTPDWSNVQQGTVSYGGPIIKNKTFFFALYDQQFAHARGLVSNMVLTDTARNGVFRYYPGWNPLNAAGTNPTSFPNNGTGSFVSVDSLGNPCQRPQLIRTVVTVHGAVELLQRLWKHQGGWQSVHPGRLSVGGNAVIQPAWDVNRPTPDGTGYVQEASCLAPHANNFTTQTTAQVNGGDGLNTAVNRYLRQRQFRQQLGDTFGTATIGSSSDAANAIGRKQLNLKVDHNINSKNRLSVQYTYESDAGTTNVAPYENGYSGHSRRRPALLTVNGTSTLSPNLVNEARFGSELQPGMAISGMGRPQQPGYYGFRAGSVVSGMDEREKWQGVSGDLHAGSPDQRHYELCRRGYCEYQSPVGLLGYHPMEPWQALPSVRASNTGARSPRDSTVPPYATASTGQSHRCNDTCTGFKQHQFFSRPSGVELRRRELRPRT